MENGRIVLLTRKLYYVQIANTYLMVECTVTLTALCVELRWMERKEMVMGNVRKSISKKIREAVYEKYDGHCAYCGQKISLSEMQVDHFIPVYKDGEETIDNYMPACRQCNFYKSTCTLERFRYNLEMMPQRLYRQMFIFRLAVKYGMFSAERKPIKFYFETVEKGSAKEYNENEESEKIKL